MFDGKYFEWNQKRIKGIIDFYGYKFFYFKKILDLGCGHGDVGGALHRLGADITSIDARQEHLKVLGKKYPGIKTVQANLDVRWPFHGQKFDIILDLGLLCHLADFEKHLKEVCASTTHLILETAVCDSDDPGKVMPIIENKGIYDLSYNGTGCRPSTSAIEKVLKDCGMNFKRMDNAKFNAGDYKYDWYPSNDDSSKLEKRRIWFAVKENSPIQFANPTSEIAVPTPPSTQGYVTPIVDSGIPISFSASPRPIMSRTNPSGHYTHVPHHVPHNTQHTPPATSPTIINATPNLNYSAHDKRFVIVIPSYKNIQYCERNILSAISQNYQNYRVIFTDDCSTDGTFERVSEIVRSSGKSSRVTLIKNIVRIGALANLYNMIISCDDDEIILTLDGDDWLSNNEVLNKLNAYYSSGDVWMTYGQYQNSTDRGNGIAAPYPNNVIENNSFRQFSWCASHLRTFYAWLFKNIKKEDLMKDGQFFQMTWDFAMMFPMLEMAGFHSKFISDILYIYNLENPINDHKVNVALQQELDRYLRSRPKYTKIDKPVIRTPNVGLLLIATGKYSRFVQGMISSADNYFLSKGLANVTYYIFSDTSIQAQTSRKIVNINIDHKPFPHASMDRFKHFTNNTEMLSSEDYLYYVDVDCLFVDYVNTEILGGLTGVLHCGYFNRIGPYENNPNSCLYVDSNNYAKRWKHYFGGGFSGGKTVNYLALAKWCSEKIDQDTSNGIIPLWHDETALNRYFLDNEPNVVLSPSYHYPQSGIERYKRLWGANNFQAKIMLLDKNHSEVRE